MTQVEMVNRQSVTNSASGCFLIMNGKSFTIVYNEKASFRFNDADSELILKYLTGLEINKIRTKVSNGVNLSLDKQTLTIPCISREDNVADYQFITIHITTPDLDNCHCRIYRRGKELELPNGIIDDIIRHLIKMGCNPAPSYQKYKRMQFVANLPNIEEANLETCYVLTQNSEDKKFNTCWMVGEEDYIQLSDD